MKDVKAQGKKERGAAEGRKKEPRELGEMLGLDRRYQIECGRVVFSEDFLLYMLIFSLIVFLIFYNAVYELQTALTAP